jgi:hypothetical protein
MVPVVGVGYSIEFEENEGIAVADEHHELEEEETFLLSYRYRTLLIIQGVEL